jgi:hypothetical protein
MLLFCNVRTTISVCSIPSPVSKLVVSLLLDLKAAKAGPFKNTIM